MDVPTEKKTSQCVLAAVARCISSAGIGSSNQTTSGRNNAPQAGHFGALRHIRVYVSAPGHAGLIARTRSSYRYEPLENQNGN